MLRLKADRFVVCTNRIAQIELLCQQDIRFAYSLGARETQQRMDELCTELEALRLPYSARSAARLITSFAGKAGDLGERVRDLALRMKDELEESVFLRIGTEQTQLYTDPCKGWGPVVDRFGCALDIEEAGKCFALERFTSSVFHLMRVTEHAVLELQCFLDKPDPKAHFGSVLARLDNLQNKTGFKDLPRHLQPYREFLGAILPQLHAVKNSWRNKVSHVGGKIVPTDGFTPEMALDVYNATFSLMKNLATGLPRNTSPTPDPAC